MQPKKKKREKLKKIDNTVNVGKHTSPAKIVVNDV